MALSRTVPLSRRREFTLLWAGQAVSQLGSRLYGVAHLLWVLALTHSPALTGLVTSVVLGGYTAAHLPGGWLADRCDRRSVMMTCNAVSAASTLSVAVAAAANWFNLSHMLTVSALLGISWALHSTAETTSLPQLVPAEELAGAVALNQTRGWTTGLLGPPLAGLLFGISPSLPFLMDGLSYLVALACIAAIRSPLRTVSPASRPTTAPLADIVEGLRALWATRFVRATAVQAGVSGFVINAAGLVVLDLLYHRAASPSATGFVLGMASAGGCAGAFLAPLIVGRTRCPRAMLVLAPATGAASILGLATASGTGAMGLAYAALFVLRPAWMALVEARWLTLVRGEVRGRVRSAIELLISVPLVVSSLATGILIEAVGDQAAYVLLAATMALVALATLTSSGLRTVTPELAPAATPATCPRPGTGQRRGAG